MKLKLISLKNTVIAQLFVTKQVKDVNNNILECKKKKKKIAQLFVTKQVKDVNNNILECKKKKKKKKFVIRYMTRKNDTVKREMMKSSAMDHACVGQNPEESNLQVRTSFGRHEKQLLAG